MWGHLAEAALLDVAEGSAGPEQRAHVASCETCRARVEAARRALEAARDADVPEPSPLYWEAFRRQVGQRIAEQPPVRSRRRVWLVPAVAAGAALALLLAFGPPVLPPAGAPPVRTLPPWSPLAEEEGDTGFALLRAMEPSPDDLRLVAGCNGIAECVSGLSDEESRAVMEALDKGEGRSL